MIAVIPFEDYLHWMKEMETLWLFRIEMGFMYLRGSS